MNDNDSLFLLYKYNKLYISEIIIISEIMHYIILLGRKILTYLSFHLLNLYDECGLYLIALVY